MDRLQDMATRTWPDWAHLTWSGPHVKPTFPPASFFEFPPASQPLVLQPPPHDRSFAHPFSISTEWYNALLSPSVPITFALVYASIVICWNSVNAQRNHKPWAISKSPLFRGLVLMHNAFLSAYSLWTFIGMVNALRLSLEPPNGAYGVAGMIDSMCKLNGPRGFGSAATFNGTTNTWGFTDRTIRLAKDTNLPEVSDVGRMWNEGLAFYGWIFYISKFYEVIDTVIILLKGKRSSLLQTYHHAGAMLCMWAGIRYMSPPIWVFVTVNSFVHFVMYAFYFLTTLGVRIPKPVKQALTTMQISQFVIGAIFAFAHLFVAYQIPFSTPYIYHLGDTIRSVASSISADASSVISTATATASADPGSWLKKLALRAAGREGLAENIENRMHETFGIDAVHAAKDFHRREETRYRDELKFTHCIDTSGQTFAIYLNVLYLVPLTILFAQFFVKSYRKRADQHRRSSISDNLYITTQSLNDAGKGVSRRLSEAYEDYQGIEDDLNGEPVFVDGDEIRKEIKELGEKTKSAGNKAVQKTKEVVNTASERASSIDTEKIKQDVQADLAKLRESAKSGAENVRETIKKNQPSDETKEKVRKAAQDTQDAASTVASKAQQATSDAATKAKEVYDSATSPESKQYVKETYESASTNVKEAVNNVSQKSAEVKKDVQKGAKQASSKANELKDQASEQASEAEGQAQDQWQEVGKKTKKKAGQAKDVVTKKAQDVADTAQDKTEEAKDTAAKKTDEVKDTAGKKIEEVKDTTSKKTEDVKDTASKKADDAKDTAAKKTGETKQDAEDKAKTVKSRAAEKVDETKDAAEKSKTTAKETTEEVKSTDIDKKDQDKIIAQSQVVRDESVNTKSGSKTESSSKSKIESGGASYAAVASEGGSEKEKGGSGATDDEDTTNTMSNSTASLLNDSINLDNSTDSIPNSLNDSYYNVSSMANSYSNLGGSSMLSDGNVDTLINLPANDLLPDINPFPEIPPMTPRSRERWHARRRGDGFAVASPTSPTGASTNTNANTQPNTNMESLTSQPLSRPRTSTTNSTGSASISQTTSSINNHNTRPRMRNRTSTSSSASSFISYGNEHGGGRGRGNDSPDIPQSPSSFRYMY